MEIIKAIIKWLLICIATGIFFIWAKDLAYLQRGYKAVGGEYLLFIFPLIWYLFENNVKETLKSKKSKNK